MSSRCVRGGLRARGRQEVKGEGEQPGRRYFRRAEHLCLTSCARACPRPTRHPQPAWRAERARLKAKFKAKLGHVLAQVEQEDAKRDRDAAVLVADVDRLTTLCRDLEQERDAALRGAASRTSAREREGEVASLGLAEARARARDAEDARARLEARVAELEATEAKAAAQGAAAEVECEALRVRLVALDAECAQRRAAAADAHEAAGRARVEAEREREMTGALKARLAAALGAAETAAAEAATARVTADARRRAGEGRAGAREDDVGSDGEDAAVWRQRTDALRVRAEAAESTRDELGARVIALEGMLARLRAPGDGGSPGGRLAFDGTAAVASELTQRMLDAEARVASLHGELQAARRDHARGCAAREELEVQLSATHAALDEARAREAATTRQNGLLVDGKSSAEGSGSDRAFVLAAGAAAASPGAGQVRSVVAAQRRRARAEEAAANAREHFVAESETPRRAAAAAGVELTPPVRKGNAGRVAFNPSVVVSPSSALRPAGRAGRGPLLSPKRTDARGVAVGGWVR